MKPVFIVELKERFAIILLEANDEALNLVYEACYKLFYGEKCQWFLIVVVILYIGVYRRSDFQTVVLFYQIIDT